MQTFLKIITIVISFLSGVIALNASSESLTGQPAATDVKTDEAEIRRLAKSYAASTGINVDSYSKTKIAFDTIERKWHVKFELKDPTPPGGHFMVTIDARTREVLNLMRGE